MEKSYKNNYRDTKYRQIAIAVKPNDYTMIEQLDGGNDIGGAAEDIGD